jgi:hypothetical protein
VANKMLCLNPDGCETEVEMDGESGGICPKCGLDNAAVIRRDRHERALETLKKRREPPEDKKKKKAENKDPFGII